MLFKKSESRVMPAESEAITGGRYLVRENIKTEERECSDGQKITVYVYEEAVMTNAEYAAYAAVKEMEAKREADIVDEYTLNLIEEGVI